MAAFGWSVGDLVSALSVAVKVHAALKDVGGAADSYRESVKFLESLSMTLRMLVGFYEANLCKNELADVQYQIELIKIPIEAFTQRIKVKFESSLSSHPESGFRAKLKGHSRKVEWALWTDAECRKLSSKVSVPLAVVQMNITIYTNAIVSAVPGHVSTIIESVINSAMPALIEHSILPLKDSAHENRLNQIINSTTIERNITTLPEAIAGRIEPAFEAIRQGEIQQSRKSEEYKYELMDRIEKLEGRLAQEIADVSLHMIGAAKSDKHRSIDDYHTSSPQLHMILNHIEQSPVSEKSPSGEQSHPAHKLLRNNSSSLDNDLDMIGISLDQVEPRAINKLGALRGRLGPQALAESKTLNDATVQLPQSAWIEASQHFQLFIKLLLRGFYDLFTKLWPLLASLFFQLRVMQKCMIRYPSILSSDDITFIDALGRSRDIPYTVYGNWETFNRFLPTHYEKVPGETHLLENKFHITREDGQIISKYTWQKDAVPGATISMAVALDIGVVGNHCPKCHSQISSSNDSSETQKCGFYAQKFAFYVCSDPDCSLEIFFSHPASRRYQPRYPVWLEVFGSIKRVEYSNMRKKVDALSLTESPKNRSSFVSDGPEPYQHLIRAENVEKRKSHADFHKDYTKILASRKKENNDLQQYFKRVYIHSNTWDPCKICNFRDYRYQDDVDRHMLLHHSRVYRCIFDFAGCQEAFANKAQWKCHINSEHLNWICDVHDCPNATIHPLNHYYREIFVFDKRQKVARLQILRDRALKILKLSMRDEKEPPPKLGCALKECNETMEGLDCWANMLEHVAEHVKGDAVIVAGWYCGKLEIAHDKNELFLGWALSSGIVRRDGKGYKFKRLN